MNRTSKEEYEKTKNNIVKILESYVAGNLSEMDILKRENKNKKCFIFGNGPSIKDLDFSLFENEVTIVCNLFFHGIRTLKKNFNPTILCAGDRKCTGLILSRDFNYIHKKNPIIMLHPTHVNFFKNTKKKPYESKFRIYKNIYSFAQFYPLKLVKRLITLKEFSYNCTNYCMLYRNVIPMISMYIAELLGFKEIYLLGCDFDNFMNHFYDKSNSKNTYNRYNVVYDGYKKRHEEFESKGIKVYNCNPKSKLDIFPKIKLGDI